MTGNGSKTNKQKKTLEASIQFLKSFWAHHLDTNKILLKFHATLVRQIIKTSPPSTNQTSDYSVIYVQTRIKICQYTTVKLVFEVTANHAVSSSDMTQQQLTGLISQYGHHWTWPLTDLWYRGVRLCFLLPGWGWQEAEEERGIGTGPVEVDGAEPVLRATGGSEEPLSIFDTGDRTLICCGRRQQLWHGAHS